jgi:hypothetical protein
VAVELAEAPADVPQPTQVAEVEEEELRPGLLLHAEGHNLPQEVGRRQAGRRHGEAPQRAVEAPPAVVAEIAEPQGQFRRSRQRTPVPNSLVTLRPSSS